MTTCPKLSPKGDGPGASRPKIFAALTGLRAFAAYLVFFHHYPGFATFRLANRFSRDGYVGVSIFFVLSGFLLQHRFGASIRFDWIFFRRYLRGRFARIYPVYFLVCLISMCLWRESRPFAWFLNLSLLKGFSDTWKFSHIAQAWSLTVEECFYALFPLFTWALGRKRLPSVALLILCYGTGIALMEVGRCYEWEGFFISWRFVSVYTFFGRAFEFLIGMEAARLAKRVHDESLEVRHLTAFGFAAAAVTFGVLLSTAPEQPFAIWSTLGLMIHHWVLPMGVALLIAGLACEQTMLSRALGSPIAVFAGKSSYAFYLLHVSLPGAYLVSSRSLVQCWFNLFVASGLIFVLIEDPINRLIRRQGHVFYELSRLRQGSDVYARRLKIVWLKRHGWAKRCRQRATMFFA